MPSAQLAQHPEVIGNKGECRERENRGQDQQSPVSHDKKATSWERPTSDGRRSDR